MNGLPFYPPLSPLPVLNPLFPACAGIRPRLGGVPVCSVVDRVNTAAEKPPDSRPFQACQRQMDPRMPRLEIIGVLRFVRIHVGSNDQVSPLGPRGCTERLLIVCLFR
jgi:hypothetical protein